MGTCRLQLRALCLAVLLAACAGSAPKTRAPAEPVQPILQSPYAEEVLADDPVAYWRMNSDGEHAVAGAISGDRDGARAFEAGLTMPLPELTSAARSAFTVELWVAAPEGDIITYAVGERGRVFALEHDKTLVIQIDGERRDTGVSLDEQWHLLSVSWDASDGRVWVTLDGHMAWTDTVAAGATLPAGGSLVAGGGTMRLDEVAWHDRIVHYSLFRSRYTLARTGQDETTFDPEELTIGIRRSLPDEVVDVAFSPDSAVLASLGKDGSVQLWDVDAGRELNSLQGVNGRVEAMAFSPVSTTLVWIDEEGLKTRDLHRDIQTTHQGETWALSISLDGNGRRAALGRSDSIRIYDLRTGELLRTVEADHSSVALSDSGDRLAIGGRDGRITIVDVDSGEVLQTLEGHTAMIDRLAFDPFDRRLASASNDGTARLWRVSDGHEIQVMAPGDINPIEGTPWPVTHVSFLAGGDQLVVASYKSLTYWDAETGAELRRETLESLPKSMAVSPDGETVAIGEWRGLQLFDARRMEQPRHLDPEYVSVEQFSYGRDSLAVLMGGTVRIWDINRARQARVISVPLDPQGGFTSIDLSPDGELLATGGFKTVQIWGAHTGRLLRETEGHTSLVDTVRFSPDGKRLASSSGLDDPIIHVHDVETGELLHALSGHSGMVNDLAFHPNRPMLASGGRDGSIRLWNLETGRALRTLVGHTGYVLALAFSPDGTRLASGGSSNGISGLGNLGLWNPDSGKQLASSEQSISAVSSIAFTPDGHTIAVAAEYTRSVLLWDVASWKEKAALKKTRQEPQWVAFSPDGHRLVSADTDGVLAIDDLQSDRHIQVVFEGEEWLAYTPDGYFDASPNGGTLAYAIQGLDTLSIDQLALSRNRPDVLLTRLGSPNAALIEHYRKLWQQRVTKAGFAVDELESPVSVPLARLLRVQKLAGKPGVAEIVFDLRDAVGLQNYQVFVDNVPLFEGLGAPVNGRRADLRHEVVLTHGRNKIEVSAFNTRGQESLRVSRMIEHEDPTNGDLYFVGFGVSDYVSKVIPDLDYADDDVLDLAAALEASADKFGAVHVRTFVDDQVTVASIDEARAFLEKTSPRDTVVLFIAGHGVQDDSEPPVYYYLTHDAQLDDLAGTAAEFDRIESLMDGIASRNKLFLLDTCQSGESIEPTNQPGATAGGEARGLVARAIPRTTVTAEVTGEAPPEFLLERDRFIYRDLRRRTGAIVLSSSRASEFSYEDERFENGAFTEAILEALRTPDADSNEDGVVSTDELRDFARRRVPEMTGGSQNPTVDRDNIHRKFGLRVDQPPKLRRLESGAQTAWSVDLSTDGRHIATPWDQNAVRLWNAASGASAAVLSGHSDEVTSVAFSPDGAKLATASADSTVKVWEVATGRELATLTGHTMRVTSVAFSPDGTKLVSGSWDTTARIWDVANGRELHVLKGHRLDIFAVAFSPDGAQVATGSADKSVRLWNAASGTLLSALEGHEGFVRDLDYSPDGKTLATASEDGTIKLWDTDSNVVRTTLRGHRAAVISVAFGPLGNVVASGSWDGTARLWDAASGAELTFVRPGGSGVSDVRFSPSGDILVTASATLVDLWDSSSWASAKK